MKMGFKKLILILVLGCILLLIGLGISIKQGIFISNSISTEGRIIEVKEKVEWSSKKKHTEITYYPRVQFKTKSGKIVTFVSSIGSSNKSNYKIGEMEKVIYKDGPNPDAQIDSFSTIWMLPLLLILSGIIFIVIYFIGFFRMRTNNKSS